MISETACRNECPCGKEGSDSGELPEFDPDPDGDDTGTDENEEEDDEDDDGKSHTVLLPITSPRLGLYSEIMLNSNIDLYIQLITTKFGLLVSDWQSPQFLLNYTRAVRKSGTRL